MVGGEGVRQWLPKQQPTERSTSMSLPAPAVCCSAWFGATASTLVMGVQLLTEHDVPDQLAHLEHHMHP